MATILFKITGVFFLFCMTQAKVYFPIKFKPLQHKLFLLYDKMYMLAAILKMVTMATIDVRICTVLS